MRIKAVRNLGSLVRNQRKQGGWSQQELAEKIGASRLWVSQFDMCSSMSASLPLWFHFCF
jgi:ribosome-binding protein aMBF1 (putative translation factor)